MKNLYTFSTNSWHVQFFKWIWGTNPVHRFETMCPYFWTYVITIISLPLILMVKGILWVSVPISNWIEAYTDVQADRAMKQLLIDINKMHSNEEIYKLYKSKCYQKYYYKLLSTEQISYKKEAEIEDVAKSYERKLKEKKRKKQQVIDKVKYGWIGKSFLYIMAALVLYVIIRLFILFIYSFTMSQFLAFLLGMLLTVLGLTIAGFIIYFIIKWREKYCDVNLNKYNPFVYIGILFIGIWKVFVMIFDMIKNLYNQSCPLITWKD